MHAGMLEAGASALATVEINAPTLSALARLVQGGRSAVAVLSPDGGMITNLSTSDLRCAFLPSLCVYLSRTNIMTPLQNRDSQNTTKNPFFITIHISLPESTIVLNYGRYC